MLCDFTQDKNMHSQKQSNKKKKSELYKWISEILSQTQPNLQIIPTALFLCSLKVYLKWAHFHGMSGIQMMPFITYTIDI